MGEKSTLLPPVSWAQRSEVLFLTIDLPDVKDPDIRILDDEIYFKGMVKDGVQIKTYEITIELYKRILPSKSRHQIKARCIEFELFKARVEDRFWPFLTKDEKKHSWLKCDFSKWQDEEEQEIPFLFKTAGPGKEYVPDEFLKRFQPLDEVKINISNAPNNTCPFSKNLVLSFYDEETFDKIAKTWEQGLETGEKTVHGSSASVLELKEQKVKMKMTHSSSLSIIELKEQKDKAETKLGSKSSGDEEEIPSSLYKPMGPDLEYFPGEFSKGLHDTKYNFIVRECNESSPPVNIIDKTINLEDIHEIAKEIEQEIKEEMAHELSASIKESNEQNNKVETKLGSKSFGEKSVSIETDKESVGKGDSDAFNLFNQMKQTIVQEYLNELQKLKKENQEAFKEIDRLKEFSKKVMETANGMKNLTVSIRGNSRCVVHVNETATFQIWVEEENVNATDLQVNVVAPEGHTFPAQIFRSWGKHFTIKFTPTKVGSHYLKIKQAPQLSMLAEAFNTNLVIVEKVNISPPDVPVKFKVDTSHAGEGDLEVEITSFIFGMKGNIEYKGNKKYLVSFEPFRGFNQVWVRFNGRVVRSDLPFTFGCTVDDLTVLTPNFSDVEMIPVNKRCKFPLEIVEDGIGELRVSIIGPLGNVPHRQITFFGEIWIEFIPTVAGNYKISVNIENKQIIGSPFIAKAFHNFNKDVSDLTLFASEKFYSENKKRSVITNLKSMPLNQPCSFFINVDGTEGENGKIEIHVTVKGPECELPVKISMEHSAFLAEFTPTVIGDHEITVLVNGICVKGTPFTAKAVEDFEGLPANVKALTVSKKGKKGKRR